MRSASRSTALPSVHTDSSESVGEKPAARSAALISDVGMDRSHLLHEVVHKGHNKPMKRAFPVNRDIVKTDLGRTPATAEAKARPPAPRNSTSPRCAPGSLLGEAAIAPPRCTASSSAPVLRAPRARRQPGRLSHLSNGHDRNAHGLGVFASIQVREDRAQPLGSSTVIGLRGEACSARPGAQEPLLGQHSLANGASRI
jgi:hypothetical protein